MPDTLEGLIDDEASSQSTQDRATAASQEDARATQLEQTQPTASEVTPQKKKRKKSKVEEGADPLKESLVQQHLEVLDPNVALSELCIDWSQQHGQAREVQRSHVEDIKEMVQESPPLEPHTVCAWRSPGMPRVMWCDCQFTPLPPFASPFFFMQKTSSGCWADNTGLSP